MNAVDKFGHPADMPSLERARQCAADARAGGYAPDPQAAAERVLQRFNRAPWGGKFSYSPPLNQQQQKERDAYVILHNLPF